MGGGPDGSLTSMTSVVLIVTSLAGLPSGRLSGYRRSMRTRTALASTVAGFAAVAFAVALPPAAQAAAAPATDYGSLGATTFRDLPLALIVSPEGLVAVRGDDSTTYAVDVTLPDPEGDSLVAALESIQAATQDRARIAGEVIAQAEADATAEEWASVRVIVRGDPTTPEERVGMQTLAALLEEELGSDRVGYDTGLLRLPGTMLFRDSLAPGEQVPAPRFWGGLFDRLR